MTDFDGGVLDLRSWAGAKSSNRDDGELSEELEQGKLGSRESEMGMTESLEKGNKY